MNFKKNTRVRFTGIEHDIGLGRSYLELNNCITVSGPTGTIIEVKNDGWILVEIEGHSDSDRSDGFFLFNVNEITMSCELGRN